MNLKRKWHDYRAWEEWKCGMWELVLEGDEGLIEATAEWMRDVERWGEWMQKVVDSWPVSCEHNLSNLRMNRVAWIGQAAVCMGFEQPQTVTREAWWLLEDAHRKRADLLAEKAIKKWEMESGDWE